MSNPPAFGVIYVIKYSGGFRYFISHDIKIGLKTRQHYSRSHFNNQVVCRFCEEWGIKLHIVAKYNGLVEGMNKIILGILKHMCAPDLGEDEYVLVTDFTHLPRN